MYTFFWNLCRQISLSIESASGFQETLLTFHRRNLQSSEPERKKLRACGQGQFDVVEAVCTNPGLTDRLSGGRRST